MKFTKFGKALLMSALSAGVILSVTSCVQDYSVGYLYVTGTATSDSTGNGIISGYKIDHNTGKLSALNGLPVASGGANPICAVLISGSRFLYVLNRGTTASNGSDCTSADPCQNGNITVFSIGGNGILTPQQTFYTQGINPFRLVADSSGAHLMVLDHDAKDNYEPYNASTNACTLALGSSATTCGDITVFTINGTTGRLSLVTNTQVNSATGAALTYFPVPANPVDFALNSSYALTLTASPAAVQSFPYTGGQYVYPYAYASSTGQLTVSSNGLQTLTDSSTTPLSLNSTTIASGAPSGTAITLGGTYVYVLDNKPITVTTNNSTVTSPSQILPYTIGSGGALDSVTGGAVADDPTLSNPNLLLVESKAKYIYVANEGPFTSTTNTESGIAGFVLTSSPYNLASMAGGTFASPTGSGPGPQCMVEDPSDQFIYTANFNDSTVTGRVINVNNGTLANLNTTSSYTLSGQPTWCLVDGRTD